MTNEHGRPTAYSQGRLDLKSRPVENSLLLTIPEEEFKLLRPHLETAQLRTHQVLHDADQPIDFGYFLNSGLASLLVVTSDAKSVEVGMVGNEGFVGAPLAVGMRNAAQRVIVQMPGEALRIRSEVMEVVLPDAPRLQQLLNRYLLLQGMQIAQVAACNRLHEIEQRLARWLLMSHDRSTGDSFPITHDLLSQMLGSGRPSVTVAAGALQRAGIIEYTRGMVKVLSRPRLEGAACECYEAIQRIGHHAEIPSTPVKTT
jgi:CRP-like cAMP-binding protein